MNRVLAIIRITTSLMVMTFDATKEHIFSACHTMDTIILNARFCYHMGFENVKCMVITVISSNNFQNSYGQLSW
jgi:hypothetical protein